MINLHGFVTFVNISLHIIQSNCNNLVGQTVNTHNNVPPPTASDDSGIHHTLDHVLTVQVAQGQILVNVLDEIRALRAELAQFRPLPF